MIELLLAVTLLQAGIRPPFNGQKVVQQPTPPPIAVQQRTISAANVVGPTPNEDVESPPVLPTPDMKLQRDVARLERDIIRLQALREIKLIQMCPVGRAVESSSTGEWECTPTKSQ
jgi:hypothetical protein